MRRCSAARASLALAALAVVGSAMGARVVLAQAVSVSFARSVRAEPVTGRVFLFVSNDSTPEPRYQGGALGANAPFFGKDVAGVAPGQPMTLAATTPGFPPCTLSALPPGDYFVQALLNVYTEFHRSDGHTIWAHNDQWEGQQLASSPGNLVSAVRKVHLGPGTTLRLDLSQVIPPVVVPADTKWVRHVKIQSAILTKFWGRPMYLGAVVLLPKDYDAHPDVAYPVDYEQDHFSLAPPYHFQEEPVYPVDSLEVGHRAWVVNMRRGEGYQLYKDWSSDNFPRLLMVTFLHPTPYYDDSYAVNSANNGPYGDAIMQELVPYIESHFRIIKAPYARVLSGGSTGGWESLALQVYHPEFFGGAWVYYPDPVDFHNWALIDIYRDTNAFRAPGSTWLDFERPFLRTPEGQVMLTERQESQLEAVLASHGRSAEQQEAWESVYAPAGPDGYPLPLWDRHTGVIDHAIADSMRARGFDLRDYMQARWNTIGSSLVGKLHFYTGDMDHFYLNLAIYDVQKFLETTDYAGSFDFGRPLKGHGYRPTATGVMLRWMADEIAKHAPPGEVTTAWHYR